MAEDTEKTKIAFRIKQIRKFLKFKQKDFALKLNLSAPTLSEWEAGKYFPSCEFLIDIYKEFNVNLEFILFGKGKMFLEPGNSEKQWRGLEEMAWVNEEIRLFLDYFEHSSIMRYHLLGQFKMRLMSDDSFIAREMQDFLKIRDSKTIDKSDKDDVSPGNI